jgi:hypothetical protein
LNKYLQELDTIEVDDNYAALTKEEIVLTKLLQKL